MPTMPTALERQPLHSVGFKISHNSYAHGPFDPARFYDGGCRGYEFDISQSPNRLEWCVAHTPGWDPAAPRLGEYLTTLANWCAGGTQPKDFLVVHLDLKAGQWDHPDLASRLDDYIRTYIPDLDRVFSPSDLFIGPGDLVQHGTALGLPTLWELRGQFAFILTGSGTGKAMYAAADPPARLCFADDDQLHPYCLDGGNRIFLNASITVLPPNLPQYARWLRTHRALVSRVYNVNSGIDWNRAMGIGFNLIAVDPPFATTDPGTGIHWPIPPL
ncbi:MAG TPA: hypothetical protein VGA78_09720 [Gemmatimonadales bacterium]